MLMLRLRLRLILRPGRRVHPAYYQLLPPGRHPLCAISAHAHRAAGSNLLHILGSDCSSSPSAYALRPSSPEVALQTGVVYLSAFRLQKRMETSDQTDKEFAPDTGNANSDGGAGASPTAETTENLVETEWTVEQVEEWKDQAAKAQDNWERLVRVSADFDNYKKRATRERQEAVRYANESLLQKLLPILDSLEKALAAAGQSQGNVEALAQGVTMIQSQLRTMLAEAGLEEIDATGQPFDPHSHEAVSQQPSTEVPEGHVIQQIRKGFKLNDRLLRPASVVVAKRPAA